MKVRMESKMRVMARKIDCFFNEIIVNDEMELPRRPTMGEMASSQRGQNVAPGSSAFKVKSYVDKKKKNEDEKKKKERKNYIEGEKPANRRSRKTSRNQIKT